MSNMPCGKHSNKSHAWRTGRPAWQIRSAAWCLVHNVVPAKLVCAITDTSSTTMIHICVSSAKPVTEVDVGQTQRFEETTSSTTRPDKTVVVKIPMFIYLHLSHHCGCAAALSDLSLAVSCLDRVRTPYVAVQNSQRVRLAAAVGFSSNSNMWQQLGTEAE